METLTNKGFMLSLNFNRIFWLVKETNNRSTFFLIKITSSFVELKPEMYKLTT